MAQFYVWVTLVSSASADTLVSGLVRKGLQVGPLASSGKLTSVGGGATLLAMDVDWSTKSDEPHYAMKKLVEEAMSESSITYHSIIAEHRGGTTTWGVGNSERPKVAKSRLVDDEADMVHP